MLESFFATLVALGPTILAVALIIGGVMILARSVVAFSRPALR